MFQEGGSPVYGSRSIYIGSDYFMNLGDDGDCPSETVRQTERRSVKKNKK